MPKKDSADAPVAAAPVLDVAEAIPLSQVGKPTRITDVPGSTPHFTAAPPDSPRYRLKANAFLNGQLWMVGDIVPWDGPVYECMELVPPRASPEAAPADEVPARPSRDVI